MRAAVGRSTGIPSVGDVPWGTHFCHFYETEQDLLDVVVPFFSAGLTANELCAWVIDASDAPKKAVDALRLSIPDIDQCIAKGDLQFLAASECCTDDSGNPSPDRVASWIAEHLTAALDRGYEGVRVCSDTGYLRPGEWASFGEYEQTVNSLLAGQQLIVLCTFPLHGTPATGVFDVACAHEFAIARRDSKWQIVGSPEGGKRSAELDYLRHRLGQTAALESAYAELERQKEILQTIIDHIPVMINFLDPTDGEGVRLLLVNREWEKTIGWSIEDAVSSVVPIEQFVPDEQARRRLVVFLQESRNEWMDISLRTRDGTMIDVACMVVPLSNGTRLAIGQDITARKAAEKEIKNKGEQLRALSARLQSAAEIERTHIARELHDELGASLTMLRWELEALSKGTPSGAAANSQPVQEKLEQMIHLLDTSIATVRRMASELRPRLLDDLGLIDAADWYVQQFESRTGIQCTFVHPPETVIIHRDQATALFRILQEALTNVLRHSGATTVDILLEEAENELMMQITDNGRGIRPEKVSSGGSLGILGMQERAHLAGGTLAIASTPDSGTTLTVRIPAHS